MKFDDTLTTLTRVVEEALVKAAVNNAHIAALKRRFSRKNVPLVQNSKKRLVVAEGCGEKKEARRPAIELVRCVVVLYETWKGGRVG